MQRLPPAGLWMMMVDKLDITCLGKVRLFLIVNRTEISSSAKMLSDFPRYR
jgi:hypothetical protein